jgi:hypothetical protein
MKFIGSAIWKSLPFADLGKAEWNWIEHSANEKQKA